MEVGKVVVFGWKWVKVFAVKCGSYGGSGGKVLGGLRRWWFGELGGEVWREVVV